MWLSSGGPHGVGPSFVAGVRQLDIAAPQRQGRALGIRYTQRLSVAGAVASVESTGNSYHLCDERFSTPRPWPLSQIAGIAPAPAWPHAGREGRHQTIGSEGLTMLMASKRTLLAASLGTATLGLCLLTAPGAAADPGGEPITIHCDTLGDLDVVVAGRARWHLAWWWGAAVWSSPTASLSAESSHRPTATRAVRRRVRVSRPEKPHASITAPSTSRVHSRTARSCSTARSGSATRRRHHGRVKRAASSYVKRSNPGSLSRVTSPVRVWTPNFAKTDLRWS